MNSGPLVLLAGVAAGALLVGAWLYESRTEALPVREPGQAPRPAAVDQGPNPNPGTLTPGQGVPAELPGSWPQFRGADRTGRAPAANLDKLLGEDGVKPLWSVPVCEGYAGPVIHKGRVFLHDYDRDKKEDVVRCLSLADGAEIWRYSYYVKIKMNHGITRTTPAVTDKYLVTLGPKGHLLCLDTATGKPVWRKEMVRDYDTKIPAWYAGQCPLIDGDLAVIAPGGSKLVVGLDLATGEERWSAPNPMGGGMTHSSLIRADLAGADQYIFCHTRGVSGIEVGTGRILWTHPTWKIAIANVPTPIPVGGDRVFFCGGYNAGACMLGITGDAKAQQVKELWRVKARVFGSDQQTPILHRDHIYGVIPGGKLACLDLDGKQRWVAKEGPDFELGIYMMIGPDLLVFEGKTGTLRFITPDPHAYRERAAIQAIDGHEIWAPMAVAGGRLLIRNMTRMVCLDVS